jgi:dihydrofolate reductase
MAHVIVSNIVSLDGFYEGPVNGVMDLPMDAAFDAYNKERISAAGTVLLGARSYAGFGSYWPSVQHHPEVAADDPMAPAFSDDNRAISRRYDEVDVLVVSDHLELDDSSPWRSRTRVVPRGGVADALAAVEGECVVFGSRTMWTGLLPQGLVDEVHLMVGPVALGGGSPLFEQPATWQLLDTRRFPGSDNVLLMYAPVH